MDFAHPLRALIPGAQGKVVEALVNVERPLTIRQLSEVTGISAGYVSQVVTHLVRLGVATRRDVPPAAQITLANENLAASTFKDLGDYYALTARYLTESLEKMLDDPQVLVFAYGSFASRTMTEASDIDIAVALPVAADGLAGSDGFGEWAEQASLATGNPISLVFVSMDELETGFWELAARNRVLLHGIAIKGTT